MIRIPPGQTDHGDMAIERKDDHGTVFACVFCDRRLRIGPDGQPFVLAVGDPRALHRGSTWPGLRLSIGVASQAEQDPEVEDALRSAMDAASQAMKGAP